MPDPPAPRRGPAGSPDDPARLLEELAPPAAPEAGLGPVLRRLPRPQVRHRLLRMRVHGRRLAARSVPGRVVTSAAGTLAVLALALLVGFGVDRGGTTTRIGPAVGWTVHEDGPQPVRAGLPVVQLSSLPAGSCGVWDPQTASTGVSTVPCAQPHDFRVVGRVPVTVPGDQRRANAACGKAYPDEAERAQDRDGIRAALPSAVLPDQEPAVCVVQV